MTKLNLNFVKENTETVNFFTAIEHEFALLLEMQAQKRLDNLVKRSKSEDITEVKRKAIEEDIATATSELATIQKNIADTKTVWYEVVTNMCIKNENGFGNAENVVRHVLKILACVENEGLLKYAMSDVFDSSKLYDALMAIHVYDKTTEDGYCVNSEDRKNNYKMARKELENIVKVAFSLPFETVYTEKTRVKVDAEDLHALHEVFVQDIKNNYKDSESLGKCFDSRDFVTLVQVKKNKRTGAVKYNYEKLFKVISVILQKHYFA